jgi:hypothetical protein
MSKNQVGIDSFSTVSIERTKRMLKRVFAQNQTRPLGQKNVPILLGPAGIGKTSLVRQVANELGYEKTFLLRLAEMRPEDITGPPFPYADGHSKFHPPLALLQLTREYHEQQKEKHESRRRDLERTLAEMGESPDPALAEELEAMGEYQMPGRVLLILDEMPNAPPEMQATAHSLVLDGEMGVEGYHLLDSVDIVATGNRREDGAMVFRMSNPMKTRLSPHLVVEPTPEEFQTHARRMDYHPLVRAFLKNNEELMIERDPDMDCMTYPTYRTWEKASEMCYAFGADSLKGDDAESVAALDDLGICLEGTVGPGAAATFVGFIRTARLAPSAEEIAQDPENTPVAKNEPDIQLVAVENMISAARRKPEWVKAFITYGGRLDEAYQALLFPALLNIDGNMPPEVILETLKHGDASVHQTSMLIDSALKAGDAAAQQNAAKKGRGR